MNTILWVIQSLAAVTFLYSGINKSIYSEQRLVSAGQTGVASLYWHHRNPGCYWIDPAGAAGDISHDYSIQRHRFCYYYGTGCTDTLPKEGTQKCSYKRNPVCAVYFYCLEQVVIPAALLD